MSVYLDHASSTPLNKQVWETMRPFFESDYGNPSSNHTLGRKMRQAIDDSRANVAKYLGCDVDGIYFTSGATEAINLGIIGACLTMREQGKTHIITSQIEHKAVLNALRFLENFGFEVTYLPVDSTGLVSVELLKSEIRENTGLVSIMYVNNEIGTIQDIMRIGEVCRVNDILFHTDAVQALTTQKINLSTNNIDMLTASGHKINGPQGVGLLYLSDKVKLTLPKGSQERGLRPGTENVASIVGFAKALEIATENKDRHIENMFKMKDVFLDNLLAEGINFDVNGSPTRCVPNIINISFENFDSSTMIINLDLKGIYCSQGSACSSGSSSSSYVLKAMGIDEECLKTSVRFSIGYGNTVDQMKLTAKAIKDVISNNW